MPTEFDAHRFATGTRRVGRVAGWLAVLASLWSEAAIAAVPSGMDFFESKVRPVFVEHCQKCHGSEKQWAGLRLDSRASALTGGDSGPAVVAGYPDESEIVKRITDPDDDLRMPPSNEGSRLNADQIAAITHWIDIGAPWPESKAPDIEAKEKLWREHWAFQRVKKVTPPNLRNSSRVVNPIDQFVVAKLDEAGLALSPEADRRTLIRRATYDLTGLPPTAEEVADFVRDNRPDAYERMLERLLASPRYGEQWGRHWLDVVRYSDTKGYVYGREQRFFVHSSHYRDWVIRAFNDDLPYDRFVLLQIAADQAAPEEPEHLAAMGFLTLGRRMLGVTPDVIEDRIDVVSRGFLGLTVGWPRCHDHKFDPIPTADYYSLYGVFQNCVERQVELPLPVGAEPPSKKTLTEFKHLQKRIAKLKIQYRREAAGRARSLLHEYLLAQRELDLYPDLGVIAIAKEADVLPGVVWRWKAYLRAMAESDDPVFAVWTAYARLPADQFAIDAAKVARQLASDGTNINPRVAQAFATPPASAEEVAARYAKLFAEVDARWKKALGDAKAAGAPAPEKLQNPDDEALRQVLYGEDSPCIVPDEPIVNTEYLWDEPTVNKMWKLQNEFDEFLLQHSGEFSYAVILDDRDANVDPRIFRRGNPMNKGETVPRQFLEVVAGPGRKPFQNGSGRLELARAIIDPTNPLTSRVWVNRVWLHHFGTGLVTSPSDFGVRSTPPSHPKLLDWLAGEFLRHGSSTKWLHRTIMLSAAYRQSSVPPVDAAELAAAQERDPDNRLLWRMNPRRLSFEQFRDTLLATSRELDATMGGKPGKLFGNRRTVYVEVDRQYLPSACIVFDFASPDFHSAQRSETTTPQQALFALNSPFLADRARKISAQVKREASAPESQVVRVYQKVLQREPTPEELVDAARYLAAATREAAVDTFAEEAKAWTYGYGEVDVKTGIVQSFHALPYFTGSAWQGGPKWPDPALGWVQLTSNGGHTGNDHEHAAIRRWTADSPGTITIESEIVHQETAGDGVRCWIVSSVDGVLTSASAHNERKLLGVGSLIVNPGDTVDFIVDVGKNLNSDNFLWVPTITQAAAPTVGGLSSDEARWNAEENFPLARLLPLEQFVQLLLISNELMFVD